MGNFRYAAKDPNGQTVQGIIEAPDPGQALAELRKQNLTVVKMDATARGAKGAKGAKKEGGEKPSLFSKPMTIKRQDLVLFTRQLATMIGAGLSLLESLEVLAQQAESPGLRNVCDKICNELRSGSDLSSAMATCPKAFDTLYISMVSAGEASGQMDVILERLAEYVEASDELRREIKSAMTYPIISLVLVLSITMFLMLGVVPTFRDVFESLDTELPALTLHVLNTSAWLKANYIAVFGVMFGSVAGFMMFKKSGRGELIWHHFLLRMPVFGVLVKKIALARFSRTFATLIRAGVPIMGTLDIVADTSGNRVVSNVVHKAKDSVRVGNMLSEPLMESNVFPPMVTRMIAIGEKTGALEQLLEKIAEFYDGQVKAAIQSLTSLIEPILISFMGGIVGLVVLSVFLPILDIVGNLSQS